MHPMALALLAGAFSAPAATPTTNDEGDASVYYRPLDFGPPLPKYRPDLSLNRNREARRRTPYRRRGIGITRSQRNPRR